MSDKAKLLKIAQKHLSKGNLDKAIKTFQQLVEVDPRDQRLILRLAEIQARAGRKKDAIENYEKVATGYVKQDFTPKAIAVYKTILRLDPELLTTYEKLAQLYKSQGLEAEALSQFENLFAVYEKKKNEDKQIEVLKLMAEMDPENLGFQVRLGETLARKGRKKEAAEAFAKAATTLSRRGFHDRASQLFEKITSLNPDNTTVRRELCAHYLESGKFTEARQEIEAILEIEPDDPRMVLLLGRILFQLGHKGDAEAKLARSLQLFKESGELESVMKEFLFVAQSHLRNGEVDEAEVFYRQILSVEEDEVRAIKGLVSVAESRRDRVGQIENLLLLARTSSGSGDREGASKAFARVHELDPLNEEARDFLERVSHAPPVEDLRDESPDLTQGEEAPSDPEEVEEVPFLDMEALDSVEELLDEDEDIVVSLEDDEELEPLEMDSFQGVDFSEEFSPETSEMEEGDDVPEILLEDFGEEELVVPIGGESADLAADEEFAGSGPGQEAPSAEMSLEELLGEAEVFQRYGLLDRMRERLMQAREVAPSDPRVRELFAQMDQTAAATHEPRADVVEDGAGWGAEIPSAGEDFTEDLEEADFYRSQGLEDEAGRIYRSILQRSPDHPAALEALASMEGPEKVSLTGADPAASRAPEPPPVMEEPIPPVPPFDPSSHREVRGKLIVEDSAPEDMGGFLDIAEELRSELGEDEDQSPVAGSADGPVSFEEIFSQFKQGIAETLGDEEYETHYNLGIAYKDMGLYDDAIREFESAARDADLVQDSLSLMAMCYMEKKDYDSAAASIDKALEISREDNRAGLYYQMGEVREKQKSWSEALVAYEKVQSDDPLFTGIGDAIERVKGSLSAGAGEEDLLEGPEEGGMEDMLSDLIREVEEMAKESSGETDGGPEKAKKDRISYL